MKCTAWCWASVYQMCMVHSIYLTFRQPQVLSEQQAACFLMPWHDTIMPDMCLMVRMLACAALQPAAAPRTLQLLHAQLRHHASLLQAEQPLLEAYEYLDQFENPDHDQQNDWAQPSDCCSGTLPSHKQEEGEVQQMLLTSRSSGTFRHLTDDTRHHTVQLDYCISDDRYCHEFATNDQFDRVAVVEPAV